MSSLDSLPALFGLPITPVPINEDSHQALVQQLVDLQRSGCVPSWDLTATYEVFSHSDGQHERLVFKQPSGLCELILKQLSSDLDELANSTSLDSDIHLALRSFKVLVWSGGQNAPPICNSSCMPGALAQRNYKTLRVTLRVMGSVQQCGQQRSRVPGTACFIREACGSLKLKQTEGHCKKLLQKLGTEGHVEGRLGQFWVLCPLGLGASFEKQHHKSFRLTGKCWKSITSAAVAKSWASLLMVCNSSPAQLAYPRGCLRNTRQLADSPSSSIWAVGVSPSQVMGL
ncbi:hypothetical protein WJX79_008259 [Trebouxia sp. C0005]